jgi:hypothetical protein
MIRYGNHYSSQTRHFDSFSYAHQDFVALVATGNSDFHRGSTGSVGSLATAKNVISVGASINSDEFWRVGVSNFFGGPPAGQYKCEDFSESPNAGKCQDSLAPFTSGGPTFDHRYVLCLILYFLFCFHFLNWVAKSYHQTVLAGYDFCQLSSMCTDAHWEGGQEGWWVLDPYWILVDVDYTVRTDTKFVRWSWRLQL